MKAKRSTVYRNKIKEHCEQKNITAYHLHFEAKISLNTAKALFDAEYMPAGTRIDTLSKIADGLGLHIADLIGESKTTT